MAMNRSRREFVVLVATMTIALAASVNVGVPAAAAAPDVMPVGAFDDWQLGEGNVFTINGWAADSDRLAADVKVQIFTDGAYQGYVRPGVARPDVAAAFPFAGANAGWSMGLYLAVAGQQVCAFAMDDDTTRSTPLGCHLIPSGTSSHDPIGSLDAVSASPWAISFSGWSGDADDTEMPGTVHVYVDGAYILQVTSDAPRPDVVEVFPAVGGSTGFSATFPSLPGVHTLCAYGINRGSGHANTTLGCKTVTVPDVAPDPHDPNGSVDSMVVAGSSTFMTVLANGWAFDPDSPQAPITVRFRTIRYSKFQTYRPRLVVTDLTTDAPRSDVQTVFSAAGPNTGYVAGANNPIAAGRWLVIPLSCAYAIDAQTGAEIPIGCRGGI